MKKRIVRSVTVFLLALIFLVSTAGMVFAAQSASVVSKEEVVYATLSGSGEVRDTYVVNIFNLNAKGMIEDFGEYTAVKNLSTTTEPVYENGKITIEGEGDRFYYQGNMQNAKLPWDIAVDYYLDGKKLSASELAGSSGRTEIVIKTTQNPSVNATFFNNYVLQITVTLNTDLCRNITAPDGTFANAGKNKLITFMVLPEKNANFKISIQTTNFEMEGIQFAAVPFSMNLDMPNTSSMTSGLSALTEAIDKLNKGTETLVDGVLKSKNGAVDLKNGSGEFQVGLNTLSAGGKDIVAGSKQILDGITVINSGFQNSGGGDLTAFGQLPTALRGYAGALDTVAGNLMTLNSQYSAAYSKLAQDIGAIPSQTVTEAQLNELLAQNLSNATLTELVANYKATHGAVNQLKTNFTNNNGVFTSLLSGLPTAAGTLSGTDQSISASLKGLAANVEGALQNSTFYQGLVKLSEGLASLQQQYTGFHSYLNEYTGGVTRVATDYSKLGGGIEKLSTGLGQLYTGAVEMSNGTNQLYVKTKDIPQQIQDKIDEYMNAYDKSGYKPISFVSEKNTNVASVQFIIKTEKIEKAAQEKAAEVKPATESFWTKLKNLFQ